MISFVNFCYFFEIFTETLGQNIRKSIKYVFQMEKKTNKAKLEIFQFFENISFIARLQPLIKLEVIMPYLEIVQKYAYQGIFACRIHICNENSSKSYDFREKMQKNRKIISFGNFC